MKNCRFKANIVQLSRSLLSVNTENLTVEVHLKKEKKRRKTTCMSMDVPVVTKNKPSNKPLKGLISASI